MRNQDIASLNPHSTCIFTYMSLFRQEKKFLSVSQLFSTFSIIKVDGQSAQLVKVCIVESVEVLMESLGRYLSVEREEESSLLIEEESSLFIVGSGISTSNANRRRKAEKSAEKPKKNQQKQVRTRFGEVEHFIVFTKQIKNKAVYTA